MKHNLRWYKAPFDMIDSGKKTIELRLYDEKRRAVNVGDTIIFECTDNTNRTLKAEVTGIYVFADFKELYKSLPMTQCGYDEGEEYSSDDMLEYYSEDKQKKYGAVGIEFKLIK